MRTNDDDDDDDDNSSSCCTTTTTTTNNNNSYKVVVPMVGGVKLPPHLDYSGTVNLFIVFLLLNIQSNIVVEL